MSGGNQIIGKSGKFLEVNQDGSINAQLTGSTVDLRGLAANKPAANTVVVGTTYWSVDTGAIEVSDGTVWRAV